MNEPIQIKRAEVVAAIRTLAQLQGLSLTAAVERAVQAQLAVESVKANAGLSKRRAAAEKALLELRQLPVVGRDLSDRDLYDSKGMPK